jgi:plastocyanin
MDRKKFIPLLLSSAMAFMWACGEGNITDVTDDDERVKSSFLKEIDSTKKDYEEKVHKFIDKFLEYCNSKEGHKAGCEAEYKKSSSSKSNGGDSKSSSSKTSSSSSSGNTNTSSSKGGNSSSSGGTANSSSSKPSSSSSVASSSSKTPETKGKCVVSENNVYIGDEVIWRYLPDEGSLQSAEFAWSFNDDDVKNGVVDGKISGTGTPELLVKFSTKGLKTGPTLTFNGKGVDCGDVMVLAKNEPKSSSSEQESSSSEPESSSAESSSSVEGFCAVSKRKVFVGEEVDWFIVDADNHELEGTYQWQLRDSDINVISGNASGTGKTRIKVTYSTPGAKEPIMKWMGNKQSKVCDRNELDENDFESLLEVVAKPVSSSSEEFIEESSSSEEYVPESSSSKQLDPCDPSNPEYDPVGCVF